MEGDAEANYAFYALHKLHILPDEFDALPMRVKAFIIASIDIKIEEEKKAEAKAKADAKNARRKR